jgi:hypothetical protein
LAITKAVGIGIADVLRGEDKHPAGDELRVLSPLQHTGQIVTRQRWNWLPLIDLIKAEMMS